MFGYIDKWLGRNVKFSIFEGYPADNPFDINLPFSIFIQYNSIQHELIQISLGGLFLKQIETSGDGIGA